MGKQAPEYQNLQIFAPKVHILHKTPDILAKGVQEGLLDIAQS